MAFEARYHRSRAIMTGLASHQHKTKSAAFVERRFFIELVAKARTPQYRTVILRLATVFEVTLYHLGL
jgi:hypothetical protein